MRNWFIYDGKNSKDYGVYISGMGTYNAPERDIESLEIPGRNGELTIDNGRYRNIKVTYPAFIIKDFNANISAFRNMLLTHRGYFKLADTYHPDEYRLARYSGGFTAEVLDSHIAGQFDINFDCYPQRFLNDGDKPIEFSAGGSLYNKEDTTALPIIRAYGNGTLTINGVSIVITGASGTYTDLDCELMEAYKDTLATSKNANITMTDGRFFSLIPGANTISFTGLSKIQITPKWWRL